MMIYNFIINQFAKSFNWESPFNDKYMTYKNSLINLWIILIRYMQKFINWLIVLFKLYKRWAKTLTSKRLFIEISKRTSSLLSPTIEVSSDGAQWTIPKFYKTPSTSRKTHPPRRRNTILIHFFSRKIL